jgi:hypothetical protein
VAGHESIIASTDVKPPDSIDFVSRYASCGLRLGRVSPWLREYAKNPPAIAVAIKSKPAINLAKPPARLGFVCVTLKSFPLRLLLNDPK